MENESKSNANVAIIDLDIQDIEGIGPTTAKKIERCRYYFCNGFSCSQCGRTI